MAIKKITNNIYSSIVVFLAAIPLCLGIALASGATPMMGLASGIIGGIVVGAFSGCPLLVSGPAGGLIAITLAIVSKYGLEHLGAFVLFAGLIQILLGMFRLGTWFQAVSPAIIHGMLSGIGVIILSNQFYILFDLSPKGSTLLNVIFMPETFIKVMQSIMSSSHSLYHPAALISFTTLAIIILWQSLGKVSKAIPPVLAGVIVAMVLSSVLNLNANHISLTDDITSIFRLPNFEDFKLFLKTEPLLLALSIAFIGSIQALLGAVAIDKISHTHHKTNYNQEIVAQGIGNITAGFLGLIPVTGVVVRGVANVSSGANSRASTILHGIWLLLVVLLFSQHLSAIPTSCLAAVLVYISFRLINFSAIKELSKYGRSEVMIFATTLVLIIVGDILFGVVVGVLLAFVKFLKSFTGFDCVIKEKPEKNKVFVYLKGYASFFNIPKINAALHDIPEKQDLHIKFSKLSYIDYACFDLLMSWEKKYIAKGGKVTLEWEKLEAGIFDSKHLKRLKKTPKDLPLE